MNESSYQNRFAPLSQLMEAESNKQHDSPEQVNNKKKLIRIPPINVCMKTSGQIHSKMKSLGIKDYSLKHCSIGIKIICTTKDSYDKIYHSFIEENSKLTVDDEKWKFFSHELSMDIPYKFVLQGLDSSVSCSEIKSELISLDIMCLDVKEMTIKSPRYYNQKTFIVYVKRGTIKLNELKKKAKAINYTIVKWDFYRRINHGKTRCYNCQTYGHGANKCHLLTKCGLCAGNHNTSSCNQISIDDEKKNYKCANCGQPHKASYAECIAKINYINLQNRSRFKQREAASKSNQMAVSHQHKQNHHVQHQNSPQVNTGINSYSNVVRNNINTNIINNNAFANSNNNYNLFTYNEISQIFNELLVNLSNCKSKIEQINVVADITFKYVCNNV